MVYVVIVVGLGFLWTKLPTSFVPNEDQGVALSIVQLPVGSTQEQTLEVLKKIETYFKTNEKDAVASVFTVAFFSCVGTVPASMEHLHNLNSGWASTLQHFRSRCWDSVGACCRVCSKLLDGFFNIPFCKLYVRYLALIIS